MVFSASHSEEEPDENKFLNYRSSIALVIANTIGTGIFTTSGFALSDLGNRGFVMLAWLTGGIYALAGVTVYADLARKYPETGGEYLLLRHLVHPALGTVAGWISLIAGFTSPISAAALGAELYFLRITGTSSNAPWMASGLIIALGAIHAFAPQKGVVLQNFAVLIKIVCMLVFIGFGAPVVAAEIWQPSERSIADLSPLAFAVSLTWISYAYSGWNAAVYVAGDVKGGGQVVERALYAGTLLVIALYLGVSAVILYGAPVDQLRGVAESGAVAARALGGPKAEQALSALIGLALVTSASSMLVCGPRVYAQMAKGGVLPRVLAKLTGIHPRIASLTQASLCLIVIWVAQLREILEFVGVTLSLSAGAVVAGWLKEELKTKPSEFRFFELAAAVFFLIVTVGIVISSLLLRPMSVIASTGLILIGLVAHVIGNRRSNLIHP